MAAKQRMAAGGASMRFQLDPSLTWIFGAPARGALDSERGLVEYVLTFINGRESPVDPDPQLSAQPLLDMESLLRMRENWRAALRDFVSAFRSDRAVALRSIPKYLLTWRSTVITQGQFPSASLLDVCVSVDRPETLRALFALLVADNSRPFGRALCQCQLTEALERATREGRLRRKMPAGCARFFLERGTAGRPQRLYCSRKHMLAAHAARER